VKKRKEEEKRKKELELTKKTEAIAENMEKEPGDDDDDESLFEAHEMLMSDPVKIPQGVVRPPPAPAAPIALAPRVAPTSPKPLFRNVLQTFRTRRYLQWIRVTGFTGLLTSMFVFLRNLYVQCVANIWTRTPATSTTSTVDTLHVPLAIDLHVLRLRQRTGRPLAMAIQTNFALRPLSRGPP
jgi:hypothetical protein